MKSLIGFSFFLILLAGVCVSVVHLDNKGHFNLEDFQVEIVGGEVDKIYLAPYLAEMRKELNSYTGESLFRLSISEISDSFVDEHWIEKISIVRRWPREILVRVEPKTVLFAYFDKKGVPQLVDDNGTSLGAVALKNLPDVAIAQGEVFEENPELRKQAVELLNALPEKGILSRETISSLHHSSSHGFWLSLVEDDLRVRMGESDFAKKGRRVGQVLQYLKENNQKGVMIDANFNKKVLVRLQESN